MRFKRRLVFPARVNEEQSGVVSSLKGINAYLLPLWLVEPRREALQLHLALAPHARESGQRCTGGYLPFLSPVG